MLMLGDAHGTQCLFCFRVMRQCALLANEVLASECECKTPSSLLTTCVAELMLLAMNQGRRLIRSAIA